MSMFLELSSRMIDYLPEEVSKIQRTIEIALTESNSEEEMFAKVDSQLTTNHLREGAREFWDVWSNASDYAEPVTEGFGGFPIDKANVAKNRGKDRNIGRVFDINGQQVLAINKRSSGDYVLMDKTGRRMVKKGDAIGATRTEKVEVNLLDVLEEEDYSSSESPNPSSKKKAGKTTVVVNPKLSDLMKEGAKKDYDGDGKLESGAKEHAGAVHNAIQRKKGGKPDGQDTTNIKEKIDVGADAGKTISDFVKSKDPRFEGDTKKQRIKRALGAYYGAQKEEVEIQEDKDPCWKGYQMVGMKKKGGREVPNCVPKEEYEDLVGQLVSEGYEDEQVREILEAIEDGFEVIFEENGYSVITEETLDEEAQFLSDVEMVADWLHAEGIIQNEDEFFALMEDLSEDEIEELYDVVLSEAEGSYGQTPKARSAMGKLAVSRMRKPASEYSQRGEKTKKLKAAEKHTRRQDRLASGNNRHGSRGPMDQARRNWSRGADEYGHTGYDGEGHGGSVTKNPKKLRKQKAMGEFSKEDYEIFDTVLEFLCAEGYVETLEEAEWLMANELDVEDIEAILEAEGSYGKTPKASAAYSALVRKRTNKPASEYSKKGEKTKKVKSAEKHMWRSLRGGPHHGRGKMTADDRTERRSERAFDLETSYGSGSVTKNPKKLRKQKAMGEIAKEQFEIDEATAMAKRGYDETKLRQRAGGGEAADRATSLENRPTYGDANKAKQRQNYARAQRGDFRKTASSNPGLHGYAHKSDDPKVKAKQAARGAQRGALTPNEKKNLNMGYEMIGDSLEEGGMEVRTYSWREVMGEAWKKGGKKNGSC